MHLCRHLLLASKRAWYQPWRAVYVRDRWQLSDDLGTHAGTSRFLQPVPHIGIRDGCLYVSSVFLPMRACHCPGCCTSVMRRQRTGCQIAAYWIIALVCSQIAIEVTAANSLLASAKPPLQTRGRHIVDATGRRIKLKCVSWSEHRKNGLYQVAYGSNQPA